MWAVYKKELKSYFLSPIGYVVIGILLLVCSVFFYLTAVGSGSIDLGGLYFYVALYGLIITVPILTMRMFAEERKNGTEQILMTAPRSAVAIVLGKFLAALVVIAITELFTLIYFGIICYFKTPDIPTVLVTMFGFLITSMAYISLGMFISSLTENQIIAAVSTIAIFVLAWLAPSISTKLTAISLIEKFYPFATGVFPITETISLISITAMFVALTMVVIKRRKLVK